MNLTDIDIQDFLDNKKEEKLQNNTINKYNKDIIM